MSITIENPTAESALQALQKLPKSEMERLRLMLTAQRETPTVEAEEWERISSQAATRFFDEEEKG